MDLLMKLLLVASLLFATYLTTGCAVQPVHYERHGYYDSYYDHHHRHYGHRIPNYYHHW